MSVFLHALSIKNYRGIGEIEQRLSGLSSFNFFIGANNSGKSTVLNLISRHFPIKMRSRLPSSGSGKDIDPLERHGGNITVTPQVGIGLPATMVLERSLNSTPVTTSAHNPTVVADLRAVIDMLADDDGVVWFQTTLPPSTDMELFHEPWETLMPDLHSSNPWSRLYGSVLNTRGGGPQDRVKDVVSYILRAQDLSLPTPVLIPAMRRVGPKGDAFNDYSGTGLIERLAEIQNPTVHKRSDRLIFDRVNALLQNVTGSAHAQIEVPHDREHILVHIDDRVLPLENLGTGIQQVIMIAAFCTISEGQLVCIEEPELHLHPGLQRKLMSYLQNNTSNQYFIATHSASVIDTPGATIFHVRLSDGLTAISRAKLDAQRHAICMDLGHRASDIVQTNAIIWVEGPSDRIYIKHWIRALDDTLIEGTHYSIMFYGGRSLSHLSADDDDVEEFIQLRDLNRNLAIVIDSDKGHAGGQMNDTKKRLQEAFAKDGGVAWITRGREIENYVPFDQLQAAVQTIHSASYGEAANPGGRFDHALHFKRSAQAMKRNGRKAPAPVNEDVDKVKVARKVCEQPADLTPLDLRERIGDLVDLVRRANHLPARLPLPRT